MGTLHTTSLQTLRIQTHVIVTQLFDDVDFLEQALHLHLHPRSLIHDADADAGYWSSHHATP